MSWLGYGSLSNLLISILQITLAFLLGYLFHKSRNEVLK
jgi:hypothetical protein